MYVPRLRSNCAGRGARSSRSLPPLLLLVTVMTMLSVPACTATTTSKTVFSATSTDADSSADVTGFAADYTPLRVTFSSLYFETENETCVRGEDAGNLTCTTVTIINNETRDNLFNIQLPAAAKLHEQRLNVRRYNGNITTSDTSKTCDGSVTSENHTTVCADADVLIFVVQAFANPNPAAYRSKYGSDGRPTVGVIELTADVIEATDAVRWIAQLVADVLGFDVDYFKRMNMSMVETSRRGKKVTLLTSANVVAQARKQYGCATLEGMEIESYSTGTLWASRVALTELMGSTYFVEPFYYSALTLAAFQDTGVYRVNYDKADVMTWGRNAGCNFTDTKCVLNGVSQFPDAFCTEKSTEGECTQDYAGVGECNVVTYKSDIVPPQFQYFQDPQVAGSANEPDYCPYVAMRMTCEVEPGNKSSPAVSTEVMQSSAFGSNSRCVTGKSVVFNDTAIVKSFCVETECIVTDGVKELRVRPKGGTWVTCKQGGAVSVAGNGVLTAGSINCPDFDRVCANLPMSVQNTELTEAPKSKKTAPWVWGVTAVGVVLFIAIVASIVVVVWYKTCRKSQKVKGSPQGTGIHNPIQTFSEQAAQNAQRGRVATWMKSDAVVEQTHDDAPIPCSQTHDAVESFHAPYSTAFPESTNARRSAGTLESIHGPYSYGPVYTLRGLLSRESEMQSH